MLTLESLRSGNIGFGTVWKTVQLLRCFSNPNIGVHHEKLFDLVDLFPGLASILPIGFQDSGNQCLELVK